MITKRIILNLVESKADILDLSIKKRTREYIYARSVYYVLCTKYKLLMKEERTSLESIGKLVNRDHATVIHGINLFNDQHKKSWFKKHLNIYRECVRILNKNITNNRYRDFKKAKDLRLLDQYYRIRHIETVEKQHRVINNYREKLKRLSDSNLIYQISKLSDEDFKEFEFKFTTFLKVKEKFNKPKQV